MKPKVYFTKTVTPEKVIEMYKQLDCKLPGNIAIKVHFGEFGNKNFLRHPIDESSRIRVRTTFGGLGYEQKSNGKACGSGRCERPYV